MTQDGGATQVTAGQTQGQSPAQGQQQIQLQQNTNTTAMHGGQTSGGHHHGQATAMPAQVQVLQPGQYTLPGLQGYANGQMVLNGNIGNILHPGLNQGGIQVITPGRVQGNQLNLNQQIMTSAAGYAVPTSQGNNPQYFFHNGQFISAQSVLQQTGQGGKPGEMPKVIQPQMMSNQHPQQVWPQLLGNQIIFRGQNDQQMFMLPNTSNHPQFSMQQLAAGGQIQTSISQQGAQALQAGGQAAQQQQQQQQQQQMQQQQQANSNQQVQNQMQQLQNQSGSVSISKGPAQLQPKPPQIQPQQSGQQGQQQMSGQSHSLQQQQQMNAVSQIQQIVQNGHHLQLIPHTPTSQASLNLGQSIMTSHGPQITIQPAGMGNLRFTTLSHQQQQQGQQPQVSVVQHQIPTTGSQPQAIRPAASYTIVAQGHPQVHTPTSQAQQIAVSNNASAASTTPTVSATNTTPKGKNKKAPKGSATASPSANAGSQSGMRAVFPRPPQQQPVLSPMPTQISNGTLTLMSMYPQATRHTAILPNQAGIRAPAGITVSMANPSPLKAMNMAAPPNLPDATLTPLNPNTVSAPQQTQPVMLYPGGTALPNPNISITPAPPPQIVNHTPVNKNEAEQMNGDAKGDTEKENARVKEDVEEANHRLSKPPKAMVKPQVLTHVIEGFVIQEASEPFPIPKNGELEEPPKKKSAMSIGVTGCVGDMGVCKVCGTVTMKEKLRKKKFCSASCETSAKKSKSAASQQQSEINHAAMNGSPDKSKKGKKWGEDSDHTDETNSSVGDSAMADVDEEPKVNPAKWSVEEVVEFVKSLPGCTEYAEDFLVQEIDGQALMLLKEEHLMSGMGMKLGPALKICNKIESLRAAYIAAHPNAAEPAK